MFRQIADTCPALVTPAGQAMPVSVGPVINFTVIRALLRLPGLPSTGCRNVARRSNGAVLPVVLTFTLAGFRDEGTMVASSLATVSVLKPALPCTVESADVRVAFMLPVIWVMA